MTDAAELYSVGTEYNFYGMVMCVDPLLGIHDSTISPRFIVYGPAYRIDGEPIYRGDIERPTEKDKAKAVVLVLRDIDRKIPLVHVGMRLNARIRRALPLPRENKTNTRSHLYKTYASYEYTVVYVKRCKIASLTKPALYQPLLAAPKTFQILEDSVANLSIRVKSEKHPLFRLERDEAAKAGTMTGNVTAQRSIGELTFSGSIDKRIGQKIGRDFANLYAATRNVMQWTAGNGNALEICHGLLLDAYYSHTAALCDLNLLTQIVLRYKPDAIPPFLLFFGAAVVLPVSLVSSNNSVTAWPGTKYAISAKNARAFLLHNAPTMAADLAEVGDEEEENDSDGISLGSCDTETDGEDEDGEEEDDENNDSNAVEHDSEQNGASSSSSDEEPLLPKRGGQKPGRVFKLAHEMYRSAFFIQRSCGIDNNTVFDGHSIARLVTRKSDYTEKEKDLALQYLLAAKFWRPLPRDAMPFSFVMSEEDAAKRLSWRSLLVGTRRDWHATSTLLNTLDNLQPLLLLDSNGGSSTSYIASKEILRDLAVFAVVDERTKLSEILWLTAGGAVLRKKDATHSVVWPIDVVSTHAQHDDNEARYVFELASMFQTVVVCDVHLLQQSALTQLARLLHLVQQQRGAMKLPRTRIVLCGDAHAWGQTTIFARLYDSPHYRTHKCIGLPVFQPLGTTTEIDRKRYHLRHLLRNLHTSAFFRTQLIEQLIAPPLARACDVCFLETAARLGDRMESGHGERRYIIMAQSYMDGARRLMREVGKALLARNTPQAIPIGKQLLAICATDRAIEQTLKTLVLFAAPFVAYKQYCVRVRNAWVLKKFPKSFTAPYTEEDVYSTPLQTTNKEEAALSLDNNLLFIELDNCFAVDHRICCMTWSSRVMHVACHRHELESQSLPLVRDALPLAGVAARKAAETLLCGTFDTDWFCYQDLYDALITATPFVGAIAVCCVMRDRLSAMLQNQHRIPQTLLSALLALN